MTSKSFVLPWAFNLYMLNGPTAQPKSPLACALMAKFMCCSDPGLTLFTCICVFFGTFAAGVVKNLCCRCK